MTLQASQFNGNGMNIFESASIVASLLLTSVLRQYDPILSFLSVGRPTLIDRPILNLQRSCLLFSCAKWAYRLATS
jgi:hypothetical protein